MYVRDLLSQDRSIVVTSVDVKEYLYCPRLIYFTRVLGIRMPVTDRMRAGIEFHEEFRRVEARRRRVLSKLLLDGARVFSKLLVSRRLGLRAVVDYVVIGKDVVPVEIKLTDGRSLRAGHRYQLAFQAIVLEQVLGRIVTRGIVYYAESDTAFQISIRDHHKVETARIVGEIRKIVRDQMLPDVIRTRRCSYCQLRNACP